MLRIDFLADVSPLAALDRLVDVATPLLADFGYEVEARGDGWAHWAVEPSDGNVIRAYAFETAEDRGVSVIGQGKVPNALPQVLHARLSEATGWQARQRPG